MGVQPIETDFKGPLPKDTMGLLFRRSLSALKGLQITPGVINPDYKGVVKILVASLSGISLISPGDRIAQLLLLPSLHKYFPANNKIRGERGLGSTGSRFAFLSMELGDCPMLTLEVEG
jgi:dUTPase